MDDIITKIIGVVIFTGIIGLIANATRNHKEGKSKKKMNSDTEMNTRSLFLETLTKMGCQYKLGEGDDTRIYFDYQGEHFFADMNENSIYVHIWDVHWAHVELYDIDEVSRLRKAINNANLNTEVVTIYTIDNDAKTMDVHTKSTIPFMSSMPDLEDYLRTELNEFFHAHHFVGSEMHKLREQEQHA